MPNLSPAPRLPRRISDPQTPRRAGAGTGGTAGRSQRRGMTKEATPPGRGADSGKVVPPAAPAATPALAGQPPAGAVVPSQAELALRAAQDVFIWRWGEIGPR